MADNELKLTSAEQVAYDLMMHIAHRESSSNTEKYEKPDPRTYYLTLFHQCIKAGHGGRTMRGILDDDSGSPMPHAKVIR